MVPAPSAATVAVFLAGVISVTLVGYILLRRRKNGTATGQGDDSTSSPNAKSTSRCPSPIPSTQASAATGQDDDSTSSPNAKSTNRSPSPIPSTRASDSLGARGTGAIGTNHGFHDSNKLTVDASDQVKTADSPQGIGAIGTNPGVDGSNEPTVDASDQVQTADSSQPTGAIGNINSVKGCNPIIVGSSGVTLYTSHYNNHFHSKREAATGQGDDSTSSPNAKSTSRSLSPIPSTQTSDFPKARGTGVIGTNHGVNDSNEPTVDASDQVKTAAATGQVDISTSSPNAKSTSRSPSPIPSTQASDSPRGTGAIGIPNHGVDGTNEPTIDASDQVQTAAATGQRDVPTSSPNAKSISRSPTSIPSTQASAASGQGDVSTSSPKSKPTNRSPSPIPSTQASDVVAPRRSFFQRVAGSASILQKHLTRMGSMQSNSLKVIGYKDTYIDFEDDWFAQGTSRRVYRGIFRGDHRVHGKQGVVKVYSLDLQEFAWEADNRAYLKAHEIAQEFNAEYQTSKPIEFIKPEFIDVDPRTTINFLGFKGCPNIPKKVTIAVERYLEGEFVKFSNNMVYVHPGADITPAAFSHYSYHVTDGKILVCDLQGVRTSTCYKLTDPAVHSGGTNAHEYGPNDWGKFGIVKFFMSHECNELCKELKKPKRAFDCTADEWYELTEVVSRMPDDSSRALTYLMEESFDIPMSKFEEIQERLKLKAAVEKE